MTKEFMYQRQDGTTARSVSVVVESDVWERLKEAADEAGMTLSRYCRPALELLAG